MLAAEIKGLSEGTARIFVYDPKVSGYVEHSGHELVGAGAAVTRLSREEVWRLSANSSSSGRDVDRLHFIDRGDLPICAILFGRKVENRSEILSLSSYYPLLYDIRTNERILFNINEPVDFSHPEVFFDKLAEIVCNSSGMDSGAYRNLTTDGELKCIFTWKHGSIVDRGLYTQWDCHVSDYKFFEKCIGGDVIACRNIIQEYPEFAKRSEQNGIISFCAVPVQVGQKVDGVLTVAQRHEYIFSQIEREGFKSIANAVGVAISNFRNFHQARHEAQLREKELSSAASVEIAQSIRHEIIGSADLIKQNCTLATLNRNNDELFQAKIATIKSEADVINNAVRRMKQAMDFERTLEFASIEEIIDDSFGTLGHRLSGENIDYNKLKNYSKLKINAKKYLIIPNLIRFVLHNLILNSVESLSVGRKRNREIMAEIEKSDDQGNVIIRYFDNGQGLDIGVVTTKLLEFTPASSEEAAVLRGEYGEKKRKELIHEGIFKERITTKAGGSGYGLYLARKMAEYHGGSIVCFEPQDRKWSIGFRIDFSTSLARIFNKNQKVVLRVRNKEEKELAEDQILDVMASAVKQPEIVYPTDFK